jgi:hypothetical protein
MRIMDTVFLWIYVFELAMRFFAYGITKVGFPIGKYEDIHTGLPAYTLGALGALHGICKKRWQCGLEGKRFRIEIH